MEQRALYNSLRLNWKIDPTMPVKPWQVADYRSYSVEQLFQSLDTFGIRLNKSHFNSLAEEVDTPEELAQMVTTTDDQETADHIYLLLFELWRRLLPERQSLSIFCDELDHQIDLYDTRSIETTERIEDAIADLLVLLRENSDEGVDPHRIFESILEGCAHDIESFLYDFIATQLDHQNFSYAEELSEAFLPFMMEPKWFEFLYARAIADRDIEESHRLIHQLIKDGEKNPDLEFNLELLAYLAEKGEERHFLQLIKNTLPLIKEEADFEDLLSSSQDFFHFKGDEEKEKRLATIKKNRSQLPQKSLLSSQDPDLKSLQTLFKP